MNLHVILETHRAAGNPQPDGVVRSATPSFQFTRAQVQSKAFANEKKSFKKRRISIMPQPLRSGGTD